MKSKNTSIKKNYFYNLLYQIFVIIIPLITTPYISRVLGSDGIGQYSFCYSIASYFVLFGALGFNTYAQREVAIFQGDKNNQTLVFWEVFILRIFSVFVSAIIYFFIIQLFFGSTDYYYIFLILLITVLSTIFDITFLYQGNEEFGFIVLRNAIIKLIGIASIFIFVRKSGDVWIYALCQSVILILSNLTLWTRIKKVLVKVDLSRIKPLRHLLPTLKIFIPTIAASIYTMLDRTLIGVLVTGETTNISGEIVKIADVENGYYEQSEKIVKLILTVLTSLGVVMIPRNSNVVASGNKNEFISNIYGAFKFVSIIGFPLAFGLAAISFNFCPWFFGDGYEKVPLLIIMFCPLILIIGCSNILGVQYLLPLKKDNFCSVAIVSGAVLNLILNIILIPLFLSYGACIASISAELIVVILMFIFSRKDIKVTIILKECIKPLISATIMFLVVYFTSKLFESRIIFSLILIIEGIIIYFSLLLLLREKTLITYIKKIFKFKEHKGE